MISVVIRLLVLVLTLVLAVLPAVAQPAGTELPRLADGKPDLNGIWQALGSAHYDIERHMAKSSMMLRRGPHGPLPAVPVLALGAVGAVPGGMGVVEGGKIPYKPEALERREENREHWIERDPEIKCYLPGIPRAVYMPFPFQVFQNENSTFFAYEFAGAVRDVYFKDVGPAETDSGWGSRSGAGKATHWSSKSRASMTRPGLTVPAHITATS